MEKYPGDLLAGVFPLVFAVDAIIPVQLEDHHELNEGNSNDKETQKSDTAPKLSSNRSLFDRFLDALASSLVDEEEITPKSRGTNNNPLRSDALSSLLRGEDDDSSDEDETSMDSSSQMSKSTKTFRRGVGSPSLGIASFRKPTISKSIDTESMAFARTLTAEKFFQRARVLACSTRHGFPPSKDEAGSQNFAVKLSQARSAMAMNPTNTNAHRLRRVLESKAMDGILPQGWLEKHVHALPSILVVVTSYQGNSEHQDKQDQRLVNTLDHMRESLATKRECSIHLVVLSELNGTSDEWISKIRANTHLQASDITLVHTPDLDDASAGPGMPSSPVMKKIYKTMRDASWSYYQNQARQAKRKLSMLGHDHQPALLPLAIRYAFKAGIFYEFQLKHEKSLKCFSESYRQVQIYYRQMLLKSISWDQHAVVIPQRVDGVEKNLAVIPHAGDNLDIDNSPGIEVTLNDDDEDYEEDKLCDLLDVRAIFSEMKPPADMSHQCRAVANWLNFKLMQAGFQCSAFSESDEGILAASSQWRKHSQVFLKKNDPNNPDWNFWKYISHQRQVMSQLAERYPPKSIQSLSGLARDEVLQRCNPWSNYSSAAEAMLKLGAEVHKAGNTSYTATVNTIENDKTNKSSLRGQFVGGLNSEGLGPILAEESKLDHKALALVMTLKAISFFKVLIEKEKSVEGKDPTEIERLFNRSAARMHYLAGGILLGQQKHKESILHLEKTVKYSVGWNGLELVARRMLIECYEKHIPTQDEVTDEQSKTIASMILDSYFNAEMSSKNLRRALNNFSSLTGGGIIKWHHECIDEMATSLPFSFSITFPGSTHAITGDTIPASVMIKSNLDYAVHVNSVTLLTMAGNITVPSNSLRSAEHANEGSDGGIIIQANTSILLSTQIDVPISLDSIATDESGNGGEKEGVAGKGSFATSARPRSAGITSAAGARLISEQSFRSGPMDGNAQWSLRYLGGKTLRCDGICLVFYPVHTEKLAVLGGTLNVIELTIEKKQYETTGIANIKRTPFEEDNYIASAWARPKALPLIRGPRCLRVLCPIPQMLVTDMTDPMTNGKALEGTVNRILLKLQAGPSEECRDIRYKVACSTTQLSLDGSTNLLGSGDDIISGTHDDDQKLKNVRCPVFVQEKSGSSAKQSTQYGFDLPPNWEIHGSGVSSQGELTPDVSVLKAGEMTYVFFDLYRPARNLTSIDAFVDENVGSQASILNVDPEDSGVCQTDFDVSVTYKQVRPKAQQTRTRRRQRPAISQSSSNDPLGDTSLDDSDTSDLVYLTFNGTVVWTSPISASFVAAPGIQKAYPSGSRHPSNSQPDKSKEGEDGNSSTLEHTEVAMIDGEIVSTHCILEANNIAPGTNVTISKIRFEDYTSAGSDRVACAIKLVSDSFVNNEYGVLYSPNEGQPFQKLTKGSKFGIVYSVKADMLNGYKKGSVSDYLGVICVDWSPMALALPKEFTPTNTLKAHGPLVLDRSTTLKFRGPPCYIESAPFEAIMMMTTHHSPHVAIPFEVSYRIVNKTILHQNLIVGVTEREDGEVETLLVSGAVSFEIGLSPLETQTLTFTAIATKAGKAALPAISVSCERYKTWVINDALVNRQIFVLP